MEQKELKRIGIKVTPLKIIIVLFIIVSLSAISLALIKSNSIKEITGKITNNIQSEGIIPEADAGNIISVPEDEINQNLFTPVSQNMREYCNHETCVAQIGNFNYMEDSDLAWKEFTQVVKFYNSGNDLIAEWNGKTAVFEIGFEMKDKTKISLDSAKSLSSFISNATIYDESSRYRFDFNISGINEIASNVNGIYIKPKSTDQVTAELKDNEIIFKDIKINLDDAIANGFIISGDTKDNSITISNISDKQNIFIDPILTLTNISGATESVRLGSIISAGGGMAKENMSIALKFDTSIIPSDAWILDAKLGLYTNTIEYGGGITIYGLNCSNQSWTDNKYQTPSFYATGAGSFINSCKGNTLFKTNILALGWKLFSVTPAVNASYLNNEDNFTIWINVTDNYFNDGGLGGVVLARNLTGTKGVNFTRIDSNIDPNPPYLQINYSTCNCPAINTDWIISARECTIGNNEICDLGTGKLQVIDNGYLNVHGKMLANKCYFENSSSRYRVLKKTGALLKCGS